MTVLPDLRTGSDSVPFALGLAAHGDRTAVITADGRVSYTQLAARVDAMAGRLGSERRLVMLVGANTLDALVTHLAALAAGHPVLLVPGDHDEAVQSLIDAYDPDVVAHPGDGGWTLDERRPASAHELHPDLALLLSTSGSTGSPKLVRLSHENLQANAESIADYLAIRDTDRAATSLPLHYCYGLSVVHSHLLRGAGLILTDLSVADTCFWELFRTGGGTSFAGVPYTFDLLDRVGFDTMELPRLRYVTQAGGRLAPDRVRQYAAMGRTRGWELFVMYGQTEATARMAYLPPHLAETHPEAAGIPVPGGSFRLQPLPVRPEGTQPEAAQPDENAGELIYSGPNVMLGYAHSPDDLRLGRTVHELHTGDTARRTPDGLYEITGRLSRFTKILGLRIDPQQIEAMLARGGVAALCTGDDEALSIAAVGTDGSEARRIRRLVADECGLPARAVRVHLVPELPRLPTGKPDYRAVRALSHQASTPAAPAPVSASASASAGITLPPGNGLDDLCLLYAEVLDRTDVTADGSFVSLGGDSLSYVEMSLHLEQRLGHLPADWHTTRIKDLSAAEQPARSSRSSRTRRLETSVALRALAIFCIVGSHVHVFGIKGGAHILLAVAGYNFARFHLSSADRRTRVRRVWAGIGRVALPSMTWIGFILLLNDDYTLANLFLLDSVIGPENLKTGMHFWFIETLVYILIAAVALLGLPLADRMERRFPYALPLGLAALGLLTRYDLVGLPARTEMPDAVTVFWLFALGWAAAKAAGTRQRLLVTAVALATVPGFFPGDPGREVIIMAGFALLVWVPTLPSRERVNRLAGLLAGSSLYIYLTHWQIFPLIDGVSRHAAFLAALLFGIAYAAGVSRLMKVLPALAATGTGVVRQAAGRWTPLPRAARRADPQR